MKILSSFLALFAAFSLSGQTPQFTVTGTAKKLVDADEMIINVGYQTDGNNAQEVFERAQTKMAEAIKYLNSLKGVNRVESDIIRLNRSYNQGSAHRPFRATQTLSVTLTDFELYEEVMLKLMELGFNTVGGVRFSVSDMSTYKREVQLSAIAAAKEKAKMYAKALGVELGGVLSFTENQVGGYPQPMYNYKSADAVGTADPSIAPQQVEINMQVIVSYAIKNE